MTFGSWQFTASRQPMTCRQKADITRWRRGSSATGVLD